MRYRSEFCCIVICLIVYYVVDFKVSTTAKKGVIYGLECKCFVMVSRFFPTGGKVTESKLCVFILILLYNLSEHERDNGWT